MATKEERTVENLKEILSGLESGASIDSLLRKCLEVAALLGLPEEERSWIICEIEGYSPGSITDKTYATIPSHYRIPIYRYYKALARGPRPVQLYEPMDSELYEQIRRANRAIEHIFLIHHPAAFLESTATSLELVDTFVIDSPRGYDRTVVTLVAEMPVSAMRMIVKSVRGRIHSFAISHLLHLEFGEFLVSILDETKHFVASKLQTIAPDLLKELNEMTRRLEHGSGHVTYANIARGCVTVIQVLTDRLILDEMISEGQEKPAHDKTRDKVSMILKWACSRLGGRFGEERELLIELQEHFFLFSKSLERLVHKTRHKRSESIERRDAGRLLAYLYLWMADLLELLDLAGYPWNIFAHLQSEQ